MTNAETQTEFQSKFEKQIDLNTDAITEKKNDKQQYIEIISEEKTAQFHFENELSISVPKGNDKNVRPVYRVQFPDGFVKRFSNGKITLRNLAC